MHRNHVALGQRLRRRAILVSIAVATISLLDAAAFAELTIQRIEVGARRGESLVPDVTAQGRFLAPQAVSALDVSACGNFITVGTMAFSHDSNVWQFSADGTVVAHRHFPPWAPMQVATLAGGRAVAVGLAYSRVTSPDPTVWFGSSRELFDGPLHDDLLQVDDPDAQLARLRIGSGDWRTGWLASHFGELMVRGPDWLYKPPLEWLDGQGQRRSLRDMGRNLLPTSRAMRMTASDDGTRLAFGWLGLSETVEGLPQHRDAVSVWSIAPNRKLWSAASAVERPATPLPDPAADFSEMAKNFRLAADAVVPGHVTASVALNEDGSHTAITEYAVWSWLRMRPAIGRWNPPIHALNFLPRQRGLLRVFDDRGEELLREPLPEDGMWEVAWSARDNAVWCWPTSWFARGMAGAVWLPVDGAARTIYRVDWKSREATAWTFPDAVADCAVSHRGDVLVSCWDGRIYLLESTGALAAQQDVGGPARVAWSRDGAFAVVGTVEGRLLRVDPTGEVAWSHVIPAAEPPKLEQPPEPVVPGLPIYQGGRIPNSEHAYVGDIWVIRSGSKAVLVDSAGTSGVATTGARLAALGIDQVTHVLQTHSHGDHSGGGYLWRALGAQVVAPRPAELTLSWLMPMLSDYGIFPPRPVDVALPLERAGDETDFEASGLKFHALFVPGHSFDLTIYMIELGGKRIAFTGDLGFDNQDILHRSWGDAAKARVAVQVVRDRLMPWNPDIIFTGHDVQRDAKAFLARLVESTEQSIERAGRPREGE